MNTAWRRARLKRPDDVTTAESNPVGFRFAIPIDLNIFEQIIPSSMDYYSDCASFYIVVTGAYSERTWAFVTCVMSQYLSRHP